MADEPVLGVGLDDEAIQHVAAFMPPRTSDVVLWMHLVNDHEIAPDAITADPRKVESTAIMLHMHLHGRVVQIIEDDEENA